MKRIIIFRFHTNPEICMKKLNSLKKYNPGINIYGIYGGEESMIDNFLELNPFFENVYIIKGRSSEWKWKNFDLALRDWYIKIGELLDFDMAHVIEWDLLIDSAIEQIYQDIKQESIGLTGLIELSKVESEWSWTTEEPYKSEWTELLEYVKKQYNYNGILFASLGPGLCIPKNFLERYSTENIPELVHDELRIPLFGQIFGFQLQDTGFYPKWFDVQGSKYFNCEGVCVTHEVIQEGKQKGRLAFHPVRHT